MDDKFYDLSSKLAAVDFAAAEMKLVETLDYNYGTGAAQAVLELDSFLAQFLARWFPLKDQANG